MTSRSSREEEAIRTALEVLEESRDPMAMDSSPPLSKKSAEDQRVFLDLLGDLPISLEPLSPTPGAREELLRRLEKTRSLLTFPAPKKLPAAPRSTPSFRPRGAAQPLAAALAAAVIGVGVLSGWLLSADHEQRLALRQLQERVEIAVGQEDSLSGLTASMSQLRKQVTLVSSPGVLICRLSRQSRERSSEHSDGVLFVAAERNRFYLSVPRLAAPDDELIYRLWFLEDEQPVGHVDLRVTPGSPVEHYSERLPTDFSAVLVTLESVGAAAVGPSGSTILFGDELQPML